MTSKIALIKTFLDTQVYQKNGQYAKLEQNIPGLVSRLFKQENKLLVPSGSQSLEDGLVMIRSTTGFMFSKFTFSIIIMMFYTRKSVQRKALVGLKICFSKPF